MNVVAQMVLLGFLPLAVALYFIVPPRRATLMVFIGGWLFLPVMGFTFTGIPNYTKISAIALAVLIGTAIVEPRRLLSFVPRWFDIPIAIWCVVPVVSSLTNGLGLYDGMSATFTQTITWGVPWVMGRIWFSDAQGMRELAMGIVLGGLVYVPLCLFEIRMSPQLHAMLYGEPPSSFVHVGRFGGWRPLVFMRSGLEVGLWMSAAGLSALWLWSRGYLRHVMGVPGAPLVAVMLVTAVLCKSLGAIALLVAGIGILYGAKWTRLAAPALILAALVPTYMAVRTSGMWTGDSLVRAAAYVSEARADSLQFRFDNEEMLIERAMERPTFGWGGWGRSRVHDDKTGRDLTVTDGMWIIALGQHGIVGLASVTLAMLLPIGLLWSRCPTRLWRGPPAVMAVIVLLFMADNLLNAMPNPVYVIAAGAVCGMPAALMRATGATTIAQAQAGQLTGGAAEPIGNGNGNTNGKRIPPRRRTIIGPARTRPITTAAVQRRAVEQRQAASSPAMSQTRMRRRPRGDDPWGDL